MRMWTAAWRHVLCVCVGTDGWMGHDHRERIFHIIIAFERMWVENKKCVTMHEDESEKYDLISYFQRMFLTHTPIGPAATAAVSHDGLLYGRHARGTAAGGAGTGIQTGAVQRCVRFQASHSQLINQCPAVEQSFVFRPETTDQNCV